MASKYSSLNAISTDSVEIKNLNQMGYLMDNQIKYIETVAKEYGFNATYDKKIDSLILSNSDPNAPNERLVFRGAFLTNSRFGLNDNLPDGRYTLRDVMEYYTNLNPNIKGHVNQITFTGPKYNPNGREVLGQFVPSANVIIITAGNLLHSKNSPQSLEYSLNHESIHSLDWAYRSSNSVRGFFSKNKAWKEASDGKTPTEYAYAVSIDPRSTDWRKRAENLAEVGAYVQLAKKHGENIIVPTKEGLMPYKTWAKKDENKQMIKLAGEFIENPKLYAQTYLEPTEPTPQILK